MPKGRPEKGYALTPQREKVLKILAEAGGSLDDETGLVVARLRERTGHESTQALSMVIKQLETSGLVKRDVAGRRTYHIEMIPDALAPEDRVRLGLNGHSNGSAVAEPLLEDTGPADETVPGTSRDGTDYRRLADELLKRASEVLSGRVNDPKLKLEVVRLQGLLDEARSRAAELEDELIARGNELLAAKEQLRIAEHNLDTVRKQRERQKAERGSDAVSVKLTERERRELEGLKRLMQERPGRS